MEYDKHILNSNDVMGTAWKLINKDLAKDHKNHGIQSVITMVGALEINKLSPMPLISILQLSLM
jgi:hypothetical protein